MEDKILELRGLKKNFGNKKVLRGIDLEVNKGEIIGYIGPNGAGKSTTVKIILGLIEASAGEVFIFGEDINKSGTEYKKRIGYVPEVAELYESLTAKEYLTFVGELYGLKEETSLKKSKAMMELLSIEDCMNRRLSVCSKGMKQKIVLISSLMHNPDILFLDEPLSGLDANSVMIIKELLGCLASQGKTIFYSSHIMDVVEKISRRIVLVNDGVIVADGSFHELQENCEEDSLEKIFNDLTGFKDYKGIAETMTSIINEV